MAREQKQAGESTGGLRSFLSRPAAYDFLQDLLGASKGRRQIAETLIRAGPGDRVLDMGCGTAEILAFLPDVDYFGFDTNRAYIEAARSRYGNRGTFVHGLVGEVEVRDGKPFDIALAIGVLHHLDDRDAQSLFRTAREHLKPGGRLVTIDGCYETGQFPLKTLLLKLDRGNYVRHAEHYVSLARTAFPGPVVTMSRRNFPMPYTHIFMDCAAV
jgi:SAM-dependent methyltransferase